MSLFRQLFLVFIAFGSALSAAADIYGFVDDEGVPHYSNSQLDERYALFKKEGVETQTVQTPVATLPAARAESRSLKEKRKLLAPIVSRIAKETHVDAALLDAVITAESGYNVNALSPKGAMGLMQLIPETAARYGVTNAYDPEQNIRGGARYLRDLLTMFSGNLELAIAGYNAGEGAVIKAGYAIPQYKETRAYVPRVVAQFTRNGGDVQNALTSKKRVSKQF